MREYSKAKGRLTRFLILFFSAVGTVVLPAQDASFLDNYYRSSVARYDETIRLLGGIAPRDDQPLSLGSFSKLIMGRWDVRGGLMYTLTRAPRYALRELRELAVFPRTPSFTALKRPLSGAESLRLLSRADQEFGGLPESEPSLPKEPPVEAKAAPMYFSTDWEERLSATVQEKESTLANRLTLFLNGWAPNETKFRSELAVESDEEKPFSPFLEELHLTSRLGPYSTGSYADLSFGRKSVTDLTGRIVSLPLDGVQLEHVTSRTTMVAGAGTTALLREEQGPSAFSRSTAEDLSDGGDNLAPPTVLALWRLSFPETWGRQTPSVELFGRVDGRSLSPLDDGEDSFDIYVTTVALGGPLGRRTFYDASLSLQSGLYRSRYSDRDKEQVLTLGGLLRGSVRWFPRIPSKTRVGFETLLASGDSDGELLLQGQTDSVNTTFFSGSAEKPWTLFPAPLSNLVVLRVSAETRPLDPLLLGITATLFSRLTEQPLGIPEVAETGNRPLGSEFGGTVTLEPLRDLKLEWKSSIFLPWTRKSGGAFRDGADPSWKSEVTVIIKL